MCSFSLNLLTVFGSLRPFFSNLELAFLTLCITWTAQGWHHSCQHPVPRVRAQCCWPCAAQLRDQAAEPTELSFLC